MFAARCPHVDTTNYCNGQYQLSPCASWQNAQQQPAYISGALMYAVVPSGHATHVACTYILNVSGGVRWSFCRGENVRGIVTWPTQIIQPGRVRGRSCRYDMRSAWRVEFCRLPLLLVVFARKKRSSSQRRFFFFLVLSCVQ